MRLDEVKMTRCEFLVQARDQKLTLLTRTGISCEKTVAFTRRGAAPNDDITYWRPQRDVVVGVHKAGGSLTWILANTEPLFHDGETTPYAVISSFTDITELKKFEAQLRHTALHDALQLDVELTLERLVLGSYRPVPRQPIALGRREVTLPFAKVNVRSQVRCDVMVEHDSVRASSLLNHKPTSA